MAHMDCDAFYASVEKRDRPELRDQPVIVGGGKRGVVTTCCYLARISGVRSAMPMFKALKLCPQAVVIKPEFSKYRHESRRIMDLMRELTPLVQPLSLDEAWMDLSGTERLHGGSPAVILSRLQARIESEIGLTVSIGLAANKFLAKIASDLDKPRGFSLIGLAEAKSFLAPRPVGVLPGVGPVQVKTLEAAGLRTIGDIAAADLKFLVAKLGSSAPRLAKMARGEDHRSVNPNEVRKSISSETTSVRKSGPTGSPIQPGWPCGDTEIEDNGFSDHHPQPDLGFCHPDGSKPVPNHQPDAWTRMRRTSLSPDRGRPQRSGRGWLAGRGFVRGK